MGFLGESDEKLTVVVITYSRFGCRGHIKKKKKKKRKKFFTNLGTAFKNDSGQPDWTRAMAVGTHKYIIFTINLSIMCAGFIGGKPHRNHRPDQILSGYPLRPDEHYPKPTTYVPIITVKTSRIIYSVYRQKLQVYLFYFIFSRNLNLYIFDVAKPSVVIGEKLLWTGRNRSR